MMTTLETMVFALEEHGEALAIIQLGEDSHFDQTVSYKELHQAASSIAQTLTHHVGEGAVVGLVAANSISWVEADLGLLMGAFTEVPVPLGFSAEQAAHLLESCEIILVDSAGAVQIDRWLASMPGHFPARKRLLINDLRGLKAGPPPRHAREHDWVCKIIHTSGTTSTPKGVKIRMRGLDAVLRSLQAMTRPGDYARYLNLVPFSLLIEQITGIYMTYAQGGCLVLAPQSQPPLGEAGAYVRDKLAMMRRVQPTVMVLPPSMVEAINAEAQKLQVVDQDALSTALFGTGTLPLLAAGGAPVSAATLTALKQKGIDVFVGYGLSENSSVACWNTRDANRIGTVGRPMPYVECKLSEDNELGIRSEAIFAGYIGSDPGACNVDDQGWLWTGDLASIDADGYVSVIGRKKNLIITAHGRNVSPEFVESTYRQVNGVRDVVVIGDHNDELSGLVIVFDGHDLDDLRDRLFTHGNSHLSVVERVANFAFIAERNPQVRNLFTVTGRPRRKDIELYMKETPSVA